MYDGSTDSHTAIITASGTTPSPGAIYSRPGGTVNAVVALDASTAVWLGAIGSSVRLDVLDVSGTTIELIKTRTFPVTDQFLSGVSPDTIAVALDASRFITVGTGYCRIFEV